MLRAYQRTQRTRKARQDPVLLIEQSSKQS